MAGGSKISTTPCLNVSDIGNEDLVDVHVSRNNRVTSERSELFEGNYMYQV
jgi:hypothetical protein